MADRILNLSKGSVPAYMVAYGEKVVETGVIVDRQDDADPKEYENIVFGLIKANNCSSAYTNRGLVLPL